MFSRDKGMNPYKPQQPKTKSLAKGQSTLASFFSTKSSSSPKLDVKLNRSQSSFSPPTAASMSSTLKRTSSMLKKSHSALDGFGLSDEDADDDVREIKPIPQNLKNTLLPSPMPSRNSSFISDSSSQSKRSNATPAENSVRANLLNSIRSSQGEPKKRTNPWQNNPVNVKNPRLSQISNRKEFEIDMSSSAVVLSEEQRNVIKLAVHGKKNMFYTGSAGTGKSVLLRELVRQLKRLHGANAVAVTASTGLAAVNIGGVTINRFSGCGIAKQDAMALAKIVGRKPEAKEKWKRTKVLIIDEISMLDGDFLDKLEYVARATTRSDKPFGGIQVILTGDFFQLPPVPDRERGMKFCFEARCWDKVVNETILLKKVFRQRDTSFIDLLNSIRTGTMDASIVQEFEKLNREVFYGDNIEPTELFPTRFEVERANQTKLDRLSGELMIFAASDPNGIDPKLLENTMAVKELKLKVNAQVMMLKNMDDTLVNGSVGKVLAFVALEVHAEYGAHIRESDWNQDGVIRDIHMIFECHGKDDIPLSAQEHADKSFVGSKKFLSICRLAMRLPKSKCYPVVKFSIPDGGYRIDHITPEEFPIDDGRRNANAEISRKQLPLLLSWALSIHKSQGQTLDRVIVDLRKIFEAGQVYVALSRAVSKDRLEVRNFQRGKIFTNKKVAEFYRKIEGL